MSFAEEMGYNIPSDYGFDDYGGYYDECGPNNTSGRVYLEQERDPIIRDITEIIVETEKAWLMDIKVAEDVYRFWVPKSQCTINQCESTLEIPYWLAQVMKPVK